MVKGQQKQHFDLNWAPGHEMVILIEKVQVAVVEELA